MPAKAKVCRPCNCSVFYQKRCTGETRVAEYFAFLGKCKLWPPMTSDRTISLSKLVPRVAVEVNVKNYSGTLTSFEHYCLGGESCPLVGEVRRLHGAGETLLKEDHGICFHGNKKGDWHNTKSCACGFGIEPQ